jgi:hypothetical protein
VDANSGYPSWTLSSNSILRGGWPRLCQTCFPLFRKRPRKGLTTEESISKLSEDQKMEAVAEIAGPVMDGLSKLTDADSDFVLRGLLASVQMKQATGNWAAVATQEMLMIQDMELPVLLQIAGRAFMFNLGNFIGGPVAGSATVRA